MIDEPRAGAVDRPLVMVVEDLLFHRVRLSQIVEDASCELAKSVTPGEPPPWGDRCLALIIASVRSGSAVETVQTLRREDHLREAPILGVTSISRRSAVPIAELRTLGVVGLVDQRAIPELITHRINQIVRGGCSSRRFARAPVFFPVDVTVEGEEWSEYALNLGAGGLLITSCDAIDPNTDLVVRFQLEHTSSDWIEQRGRVVYRNRGRNGAAPYELGISFLDQDRKIQAVLDAEVRRILDDELFQAWPVV